MRLQKVLLGIVASSCLIHGQSDPREAVRAETDEGKRAKMVTAMAKQPSPDVVEFLISLLRKDPSAQVRKAILDQLGRRNDPSVVAVLEQLAASDPDASVAVFALDKLRELQARRMVASLESRMAAASPQEYKALAIEQDRWIALAKGAAVPSFMESAPPVFEVKPSSQRAIRVLAFGDFGQGTTFQQHTARAMQDYHRANPFDFAITLGDNFYSKGMASPQDPRWKTWWSELYDPLGIRFFASLGNHDWGQPDSPAAEVIYSFHSPSWRMPATRYTFTAGAVQFFALDTDVFSKAQGLWVQEELEKSKARWKVVYGHHPIYSAGQHGDTKSLVEKLLPILKGRADIYIAGHDHDLQHLKAEGGVNFFVAGGGGAGIRRIEKGPRSIFATSSYGFAVIEGTASEFRVQFVNDKLEKIYSYKIEK